MHVRVALAVEQRPECDAEAAVHDGVDGQIGGRVDEQHHVEDLQQPKRRVSHIEAIQYRTVQSNMCTLRLRVTQREERRRVRVAM